MNKTYENLIQLAFKKDRNYNQVIYSLIKLNPRIWDSALEYIFYKLTGLIEDFFCRDVFLDALNNTLHKNNVQVIANVQHYEGYYTYGKHNEYRLIG
jgi:hypothetical protein